MFKSLDKDKGAKLFIYLLFLHLITFQVLSILRAMDIFNTSYLMVYSNALISLIIILFFLYKLKSIRFNIFEILLLFIPILHFFFGIFVNNSYRDMLSDTFNAIFFVILFVYFRSQRLQFDIHLQEKFANWMLIGLLISSAMYFLLPLIGYNVFSVGKTSIYFIYPLIVFMLNKKYIRFIITLLLLIYASKRGVLLSAFSVLLLMGIGNRNIKLIYRTIIVFTVTVIFSGILYITISPDRYSFVPESLQPLFNKIMFINPLSEYNKLESDSRVREVKYALKPLFENKEFFLTGFGAGYNYDYYSVEGDFIESRHNVHITPITIFTRYGLIYIFCIYLYIFLVISINFKRLVDKKLSRENTILLFYVIAGLINSFTAYTLYLDYLFILSLGILTANIMRLKETGN